jgi:hypothetical protein
MIRYYLLVWTVLLSIFLFSFSAFCQGVSDSEIDDIIKLCSAGISQEKRKLMKEAISKYEKDNTAESSNKTEEIIEENTIGKIFQGLLKNDSDRTEIYANYINCVQMMIDRKNVAIKEMKKDKIPLPNNATVFPNVPIPIIDGKVIITVKIIKEGGNRRNISHVSIEVPKKSPYKAWLHDGESTSFKYYGKQYKLFITNIKLQEDTVDITVREI